MGWLIWFKTNKHTKKKTEFIEMKGCGKTKVEKCRFELMVNKNYFSFRTLHTISL